MYFLCTELHRVRLRRAGPLTERDAVLPLEIRGQGIAWDRSLPGRLYGVVRATRSERAQEGRAKRAVVFEPTPAVGAQGYVR